MKRFHVHVAVPDLATSIRFYSTLFASEPAVVKDDYAKWMLDDPRINFAISQRGGRAGINHLGLQTDSDDELEALNTQLQAADLATHAEKEAACCYALSNKYWITDPSGVAWETFHSLGTVPTFNGATDSAETVSGCCPASDATPQRSAIPVKTAPTCC